MLQKETKGWDIESRLNINLKMESDFNKKIVGQSTLMYFRTVRERLETEKRRLREMLPPICLEIIMLLMCSSIITQIEWVNHYIRLSGKT